MFAYVIRRLFIMIPTLLVISFLVFVIIQAPPGDYLSTLHRANCRARAKRSTPQKIEFLRTQYGSTSPSRAVLIWVAGLLQGDLGYSFEFSLPVSQVVGDRLPLTMIVSFATVLFIWIVAFPIGVYSATHQYSCRRLRR